MQIIHNAAGGNCLPVRNKLKAGTRHYHYNFSKNNYLLSTSSDGVQPAADEYAYDVHGNMTVMPHLATMRWDFADRLQEADLGGGGKAYYAYDAGGERVRKVIERNGGVKEEQLYLGGWEVFRKSQNGTLETERESLHIMDDTRRIALVETLTVDGGSPVASPSEVIRYQFSNHLGSAALELDDASAVISYEEYHPFGTTSYRSGRNATETSLKRYRYVGKERDEETGLYYYGARYYAAWLARFVSTDPLKDDYPFYTPYQYAGNKPVTFIDLDGLEEANPNDLQIDFFLVTQGRRKPFGTFFEKAIKQGKGTGLKNFGNFVRNKPTNFNRLKGASGEAVAARSLSAGGPLESLMKLITRFFTGEADSESFSDIFEDQELNTSVPSFDKKQLDAFEQAFGLGDVDLLQFVRPENTTFNIHSTFDLNTNEFGTREIEAGETTFTLLFQVKALDQNEFTLGNILKGFEQITPETLDEGETLIPVLVVDFDAFNFALESANPLQKLQLKEAFNQLTEKGGSLVLLKGLTEAAKEELFGIKGEIREYFKLRNDNSKKVKSLDDDRNN